MKFSEGTPQEQADMLAFRASNQALHTQDKKLGAVFAREVERMESLIGAVWTPEQAKTAMAFLLNRSWDYIAPYDFLEVWTLKLIDFIDRGFSFADLLDIAQDETSLYPLDNLSLEGPPMHRRLMNFEADLQTSPDFFFQEHARALLEESTAGLHLN